MNKQPLISIIIPVFNAEQHLARCIDSILAQSYRQWELLLVDDGSTDSSADICAAYAAKDTRIRVTHNTNQGAAQARNYGIAHTQSEWVSFIDADDWIDPAMYETLVHALSDNVDTIIWGFIAEFANHQKPRPVCNQQTTIDGKAALRLILDDHIGSYFWSMLFRRDILQEPIMDIPCYEDHATIFKWISHARWVTLLPDTPYHYRQLYNSASHADNIKQAYYYTAIKERYAFIHGNRVFTDDRSIRKTYLRGCLKFAKDLARDTQYNENTLRLINQVRDDLLYHMPIGFSELGLKRFLRLHLLLASTKAFVRVLRCSMHLSCKRQDSKASMY